MLHFISSSIHVAILSLQIHPSMNPFLYPQLDKKKKKKKHPTLEAKKCVPIKNVPRKRKKTRTDSRPQSHSNHTIRVELQMKIQSPQTCKPTASNSGNSLHSFKQHIHRSCPNVLLSSPSFWSKQEPHRFQHELSHI